MDRRLRLHEELCTLLGSRNVYFQPPESIRMTYPCIVYERGSGNSRFANNMPYTYRDQYQLTVIDPDPDNETIDRLLMHFPMSRKGRHYTADNLNHDIINIYY